MRIIHAVRRSVRAAIAVLQVTLGIVERAEHQKVEVLALDGAASPGPRGRKPSDLEFHADLPIPAAHQLDQLIQIRRSRIRGEEKRQPYLSFLPHAVGAPNPARVDPRILFAATRSNGAVGTWESNAGFAGTIMSSWTVPTPWRSFWT